MTTINLRQDQQNSQTNFSYNINKQSIIIPVGMLLAVLLILAGLKIYVPSLSRSNEALNQQIITENKKLADLGDLERVADLQSRLKEIRNNLELKNGVVTRLEMTKMLNDVSSDLNSNVAISEFSYADNRITVAMEANNFSDIAKQIFDFKKSQQFNDVSVVSINRKEKMVACSIAMNVK